MKPATEALFSRKTQIGFSLIELMVVVAIVGIIAIIAYPSFSSHLVKGRRASAQAHLMDIAQREQQYFLDARNYASDASGISALTTLNVTTPSDVSTYYQTIVVSVVAGPPIGFIATATPKTGIAQAADGALSIDNTGAKIPTNKW